MTSQPHCPQPFTTDCVAILVMLSCSPKPLVTAGYPDRQPDFATDSVVPVSELKDALRVLKVFVENDWMSFSSAMEVSKAYWNLSATIASRSPAAPFRRGDFWKARLAEERTKFLVGTVLCAPCVTMSRCRPPQPEPSTAACVCL